MKRKFDFSNSDLRIRTNFAVQLRKLDRNERDIELFKKQLASYLVEPKTHDSFTWFYKLKNEVKLLENACSSIHLRIRKNETDLDELLSLINMQLKRTKLLALEISIYLDKIKGSYAKMQHEMTS